MTVPAGTILVVDDEAVPRLLLSTNLKGAGYEVIEADSGEAALRILHERPVDAVLLDLVMPDADGFQVLRQMKTAGLLDRIPVVVVSASDDMNSVVRCVEMGATDHLSKPFDPVLLQARVRAALAIRQMEGGRQGAAGGGDLRRLSKGWKSGWVEERPDEKGMAVSEFLKRLLAWSRPYRKQSVLLGALTVVALGIEAALPLGFKFIADDALLAHNFRLLILTLAVLAAGVVTAALLQVAMDYLYARLATKMMNDLRFQMYRHLQRLSMGFYSRTSPGEITTRFTTDLASIENTVFLCLPQAAAQSVMVVFGMGLLFVLQWKLALVAVVGLYVTYRAERLVEGPAAAADARLKEQQSGVTAVLQETLNAQTVVKGFRLQNMMTERFKHQMLNFFRVATRACFLSYLTERVPGRCVALFSLLTIGCGAVLTYYGYLTIGGLVSFQVLLTGLTLSVGELMWSVPYLVRGAGGMLKVTRLLDESPEVTDAPDAVALPRPAKEIVFENVSFGYVGGQTHLRNVNLRIAMGQTVLLVGPSGSGKSTVLNLILRFYDPREGVVRMDGHDLRTVAQDSLRQYIGAVFQENFLFNTTVRENIRIGKQGATDDEVEAAARAVRLHEVVMGLPGGYDTVVGERGGNLSGGLRQQLAVARAIVSDPAILLLDGATSSLDPASAASLNAAIEAIGRGRTVVSVTSRLHPAPRADAIFVFRNGEVAESGRHEDLLRRNGLYAALWREQADPGQA